MAAGPLDNLKIGAIIQARMKSQRLPGKVIVPLPFPNGKPLILRILEQVDALSFIDSVAVATSMDASNDPLEKLLEAYDYPVVRGDEINVLSRFGAITSAEDLDIVIRLTGDNPFLDKILLEKILLHHIETGADYTKSEGLPIGMNFEILKGRSVVEASQATDLEPADMEHVTPYIRRNDRYTKETLQFNFDRDCSHWRVTIDYPADLAFISMLLQVSIDSDMDMEKLCTLIDQHPWLREINGSLYQKTMFESREKEILRSIDILRAMELTTSAKVLEDYLHEP